MRPREPTHQLCWTTKLNPLGICGGSGDCMNKFSCPDFMVVLTSATLFPHDQNNGRLPHSSISYLANAWEDPSSCWGTPVDKGAWNGGCDQMAL